MNMALCCMMETVPFHKEMQYRRYNKQINKYNPNTALNLEKVKTQHRSFYYHGHLWVWALDYNESDILMDQLATCSALY